MKQLKKLASLLLAMVMVFGLAATALASEGGGTDPVTPTPIENPMEGALPGGSITITNPVKDQTYSIYQIMYLVETTTDGVTSYVYKANSVWKDWLKTQTSYVTFDEADNVSVNAGIDRAAFGRLAMSYARGRNFAASATVTDSVAEGATEASAVFSDVKLGYYIANPTSEFLCNPNQTEGGNAVQVTADPIMQGELPGGSITITNAVVGQTYSIYQIMYLVSYNEATHLNTYKANSYWESWLRGEEASPYVNVDQNGYVTWKMHDDNGNDIGAAEFAKLAIKHASENIPAVDTQNAQGNNDGIPTPTVELTFSGLKLGYYLVDSSVGAICSLDTNNPNAEITDKNPAPTNYKEVQENHDHSWGKVNDAEIGDIVDFRSTVTLPEGSENVTYHDTMSSGLTLDTNSIKVYTDEAMTTELNASNYTVYLENNTPTEEGGYVNNHCTFEVIFSQTYLNLPIGTGDGTRPDTVYVKYSATVNADAVIGGDGNLNSSHLSYGNNSAVVTTPSTTKTYVWEFEVNKTAGDTGSPMSNVEFVLLNSDKTKVATFTNRDIDFEITNEEGQKETITVSYRIFNAWVDLPSAVNGAIPYTNWNDNMKLVTDTDGKIHVGGLDSDTTYYLREIKTANGYNMVGDTEFVIESSVNDTNDGMAQTAKIISIVNNKGDELPTTGGIGTTIFYVVGSILLVGAAILLITKKRMSVSK